MSKEDKANKLIHDLNNKLAILNANNMILKKFLTKEFNIEKFEKLITTNGTTLRDITEMVQLIRSLENDQVKKAS